MLKAAYVTTALLALVGPAIALELIPPSDLNQSFFDARPITSTDAKGRDAKLVFAPGGAVTFTNASGKASEGTWRLSDEGFCMTVGSAKRESCYIVVKQSDGKLSALKRSGQPFTWSR